MPERRLEVTSDKHFIAVKGTRAHARLLVFLKPCVQPFPHGHFLWGNQQALLLLAERLGKERCSGLACFGVEGGTLELARLGIPSNRDLRHPEPILAPCDTAFIVPAFLGHAVCLLCSGDASLVKPRHNYRYVCAELIRLYYRGYELALGCLKLLISQYPSCLNQGV